MWLSCKYLIVHSLSSRIPMVITSSVWLPCHVSSLGLEETRSQHFLCPDQQPWASGYKAYEEQTGQPDRGNWASSITVVCFSLQCIFREFQSGWTMLQDGFVPPHHATSALGSQTVGCMCAHTCVHSCMHAHKNAGVHTTTCTHTWIYLHLSLTCSNIHTNRHPMWYSQPFTALWPVSLMECVCVQSRHTVLWCSQAPKSMAWHQSSACRLPEECDVAARQ